ncbi:MAG: hypothetical protein JSS12_02830, partial [Verrucomicrobia bacterium]|nr:hypothetical protein [Verrucomicrobiota bacterium]
TSNINHLIYKDKKGNLYQDDQTGFIAYGRRLATTILGFRDYRLQEILKSVEPTTTLGHRNFSYLSEKLAKSCKINSDLFTRILNQQNGKTSAQEQKNIANFQSKLPKNSTIANDAAHFLERCQITSKWLELGLDQQLLDNDYEGAKFLVKTRLIYSIVGFQNSTSAGPKKHALKVDTHNHLMIKKEGRYVVCRELDKKYSFDKERQEVVSKKNPLERWNYFSPKGLVPIDRWEYTTFEPIEELSQTEMKELLEHAKKFKEDSADCDSVIQIFTNPRKTIAGGNTPLLARLDASFPVHAAIRIITSDGKVYSTGFGSTIDEDKRQQRFLATINGLPTMLDYEEFRKHEGRIVTSIPTTKKACRNAIKTLQRYHDESIRFNIATQNCTTLAVDILDITGQKVNNTVKAHDFVRGMLPDAKTMPAIKTPARIISYLHKEVYNELPPNLQKAHDIIKRIFEFAPATIATFIGNLVVLALGGTKGTPLPAGESDGSCTLKRKEAILNNPLDFFSSKPSTISSSLHLIQWQLQQPTTAIHSYRGPAMGILPPQDPDPQLQHFLEEKYLHNYGLANSSHKDDENARSSQEAC